ncbi:hypothetical protein HPP92_011620 [Vanilla planifolia]|uniref:Uncharacterized protein n=1 Tax=Vanilla planifolia TaxID=51239 RepID=A0A835R7E5_VANPL|nr:hypothetical protein HPP92_011620 [Vanilla planifolia]
MQSAEFNLTLGRFALLWFGNLPESLCCALATSVRFSLMRLFFTGGFPSVGFICPSSSLPSPVSGLAEESGRMIGPGPPAHSSTGSMASRTIFKSLKDVGLRTKGFDTS